MPKISILKSDYQQDDRRDPFPSRRFRARSLVRAPVRRDGPNSPCEVLLCSRVIQSQSEHGLKIKREDQKGTTPFSSRSAHRPQCQEEPSVSAQSLVTESTGRPEAAVSSSVETEPSKVPSTPPSDARRGSSNVGDPSVACILVRSDWHWAEQRRPQTRYLVFHVAKRRRIFRVGRGGTRRHA